MSFFFFFFQAEDGIRDGTVTGVQTCALPISSFRATLRALLDQGAYVGIATHDEQLIVDALAQVRERGLSPDRYEFQMLLGVRASRGDELVRDGHRLRIYVPFGTHWYEYSVRRLQENPKIAGYVAVDTVRRLAGR